MCAKKLTKHATTSNILRHFPFHLAQFAYTLAWFAIAFSQDWIDYSLQNAVLKTLLGIKFAALSKINKKNLEIIKTLEEKIK